MRQPILGLSLCVTGLIVLAGSVPLRLGLIGPNRTIGIRFAQSFASIENWYSINRFGGNALIIWALSALAMGGVVMSSRKLSSRIAIIIAVIYPLTIVFPVFLTYLYAIRL